MQCELCGKEDYCKPGLVDGVKMMLCPDCVRHGHAIKETADINIDVQKSLLQRQKKAKVKDIYDNMDKELVANWNELIKKARIKKKLSREELGFKIGQQTITIAKIENGTFRPSDDIVKKLEKELDIALFETMEKTNSIKFGLHSHSLTLGDFFKKDEK